METLQGTVSNCQHTLQVTGGGSNNQRASTTYVALFRVNSRPVEFRTNQPSSVSDGDQVVVAGVTTRTHSFHAYACRNITTGESTNSGLWGSVFALIFLPIVGLFITFVVGSMFGHDGFYIGLGLVVVGIVFLLRQILLTRQAIQLVQGA